MKPQINPAWLVSLMCRWVARQLASGAGALGYPKKACGFSEKTTGGYNHSNPVAFTAEDFSDLERALDQLSKTRPEQFRTMMIYYRPWKVAEARADGFPFGNSTYYKRLHAAHDFVATTMDASRRKVE